MHEMSLCESILGVLEAQAREQVFERVELVRLEIGMLAGIEISAIKFGFDVVMRGSIADAAKLDIVEIPGLAWCKPCKKSVPLKQRYDPCPECGGYDREVTNGGEMRIKEVEVS